MEVKTDRVKQVLPNGNYESAHGTLYKFTIDMEGGDSGEYSSKKEDHNDESFPFKVGVEKKYEWHDGQYPKIKQHYEEKSATQTYEKKQVSDAVQKMIVRQSSLQRATEYLLSGTNTSSPEDIMVLADKYATWVMS